MTLKQILKLAKENGETTLGGALKYGEMYFLDDEEERNRMFTTAASIGTYFCSIDSCLQKLNMR